MVDGDEIGRALRRLEAGAETPADRALLADVLARMLAGTLTVLAGGRSVAIGGAVSGSPVTTGDRNQIITLNGLDAEAVERALARLLPTPLQALHTIPPPPRDFTGRTAERDRVRAALGGGGASGAVIAGVRGMGGVGKTTLACVLAEELREAYPDAHLLIDLKGSTGSPLSAAEALGVVILAFHPQARLPDDQAALRDLFLTTLHEKRVLLLLDDAYDPAQVGPLLPPPGSAVLVTTRQSFAVAGLRLESLDVLPCQEARALLLAIAPRIGHEEAAEIARLCGYLPLALRLAGSALKVRETLDVRAYRELLAQEAQRLSLLEEARQWTDEKRSVEASLKLSYDLLDGPLRGYWRRLAVFPDTFDAAAAAAIWQDHEPARPEAPPPGPVPRPSLWDRVTGWLIRSRHQSPPPPAASLPEPAPLDSDTVLGDLCRYSLLEWSPETRRYSLHELARIFADGQQTPAEREAGQRRHARHYLGVLAEAGRLYLTGGDGVLAGLSLFDRERGNVEAGQRWAAERAPADADAAFLCSRYPGAGVYVLSLRHHPREQVAWLEQALQAAHRLRDRAAEVAYLGNLGNCYAELGEPRRAIELYEQALAIHREIGDRRGEGSDLGNLGNRYAELGEPRRAIELYEQALAIHREIGDRRGEGSDLIGLGSRYAELGEPRRAIELYEQALAIHREIGDRRGEGSDLIGLGSCYAELGEPRRAIELYEQALAIHREIGDRQGEGSDLIGLGSRYAELGEPRRAIELYEQALAIHREIGDRRGEGNALTGLGNCYAALGEPRRAIELYEQALAIDREIGDRRGEGSVLTNLGNCYAALGEPRRAIELYEQALAIDREIGDRRGEGSVLTNLGNCYAALGEPRRAIELYEQALAIDREIGDRRGEGIDLTNIGRTHFDLGDAATAASWLERSLPLWRLLEDRQGERRVLEDLVRAYQAMGDHARVREYQEQHLTLALELAREAGDAAAEAEALAKLAELRSESEGMEAAPAPEPGEPDAAGEAG